MPESSRSQFRERFTELGAELVLQDREARLPSAAGLTLDTKVDLSQLDSFSATTVEIGGVADSVKAAGVAELRLDTELGKLDEGIERIRRNQKDEQIRAYMEQAQRLMSKGEYHPAIRVLDKALAVDPGLAPLLILKAHCRFGLEQFDRAIELLDQVQTQTLDPETYILALILRAACVRAAARLIEARIQKLIEAKRFREALELISEELESDPSNVALLYYRGSVLLLMGRVGQAKQAVEAAMRQVGSENRGLFQELLNHIRVEENREYLEAARLALRRRDAEGALKALRTCRGALAGEEQFEAIYSYAHERSQPGLLKSLVTRNGAKRLTDPARQKLLLWLLAEELNSGLEALNGENFGRAANVFSEAAKIDDRCCIICYLHGVAIFKGFQQDLEREQVPDLSSAIKTLTLASDMLSSASHEPLVSQQSQGLRRMVDGYREQLRDVERERGQRAQEARPVNELIQQFNDLMESLQGSISSERDVDRGVEKFRDLRRKAESLRKGLPRGEATEVLDQIIDATDRHTEQLQAIREEARKGALISDSVAMFNAMMTHFQSHPISNKKELEGARTMAKGIRGMVDQARREHPRGTEGSKVLDELDEALHRVEAQLH